MRKKVVGIGVSRSGLPSLLGAVATPGCRVAIPSNLVEVKPTSASSAKVLVGLGFILVGVGPLPLFLEFPSEFPVARTSTGS